MTGVPTSYVRRFPKGCCITRIRWAVNIWGPRPRAGACLAALRAAVLSYALSASASLSPSRARLETTQGRIRCCSAVDKAPDRRRSVARHNTASWQAAQQLLHRELRVRLSSGGDRQQEYSYVRLLADWASRLLLSGTKLQDVRTSYIIHTYSDLYATRAGMPPAKARWQPQNFSTRSSRSISD